MTSLVLFVFGAVLGSFMNVLIHRIPRGQSIVSPPSSCPSCGARIRPRDNVPLLSFALLRGRCRGCGARISVRYPTVELLSALVPIAIHASYGFTVGFWVYWALACVLIVLSFVDLDERIIPDRVTIPGLIVGVLVAPLLGLTTWSGSLVGAAVGGGALYLIALLGVAVFRKDSMGGGDIKLAAMLGAFLGWRLIVVSLFTAFLVGSIAGIGAIAAKGREWDRTIPFGPFIAIGAFVGMVWGRAIIEWYLHLSG
ncbi:MAG: prepilin peptidase [Candidatus Eisenbacteria bacterium]|nr:prepilin peptidase [Candidatus Eisenbacteria bacterium]